MSYAFKKMLCRFMAVALISLPFQTGQASMIATDQVNTAATVQLDRTLVSNYLSRAETVNEFQILGLNAQDARDRVAAMTDDEVSSLAGKISAANAGGNGAGVLLFILVVGAIWYVAFRK